MTTPEQPAIPTANATLEKSIKFTGRRAFAWGCIYYVMRSAIIIFGVLTSASYVEQLKFIGGDKTLFAGLVTLLTAVDSWLKPDVKYRAFYVANDEFLTLRQKWEQPSSADPETRALVDEYAEIHKRLQKAAMP
jgi:hypothetical protein